MNFHMKPYMFLFSTTLMLGILITLTSNNWLFIWVGLELNLYSFIPLMLQNQNNQEKEAAIKYFLVQALASIILLITTIPTQNTNWPILLLLALLMKLGMAPCHFWLPSIMVSLSWTLCWILSTLQKIAPMIMLTQSFSHYSPLLMYLTSTMSAMTGGFGAMNLTQLRSILAFSSIGHMGWMTAAALISPSISMFYFMSYIIIISATIQPLSLISLLMNTNHLLNKIAPKMLKLSLIMNILSLGGLPPLFGFFPKLMVLTALTNMNFILLPFILILSSTLNLFYYMKITSNMFFTQQTPSSLYYTYSLPMFLILSTIFSLSTAVSLTFMLL
uniref:NADH-ubiquinone oxidoreductase chain 2 n=1 Tax=Neoamphitrite affinis TaxID=2716569 RepID=A0A8F9RRU9_9ANNE|nr:NADH dehydrogenase subunit 2 [Neoamphitrite affinis]